jgi:hypothetical protein
MSIPFDLQREVDNLLGDHLQKKRSTKGILLGPTFSRSSSSDSFGVEEGLDQQSDMAQPSAVMEKIFRRRSIHLRYQQHTWQVCMYIFLWLVLCYIFHCLFYFHVIWVLLLEVLFFSFFFFLFRNHLKAKRC